MVFFYIISFFAVMLTLLSVLSKNFMHALLYFLSSLISLSILMYYLGSPLTAMMLIIIYAGAVVTLFVFVVMLLNLRNNIESFDLKIPIVLSLILFFEILYLICSEKFEFGLINKVDPQDLAYSLFTKYALLVEIASFLLLSGLIGAFHLGAKSKR